MLHWLELLAFVDNGQRVVPRLIGLPVVLLYCVQMALSRAKVVCVVHDHAVHNTHGAVRAFSVALKSLVRALADVRVVHDEHCASRFRAHYLPHPLYWDVPGRLVDVARDGSRAPAFAILGTMEPYKGIAELLATWSEDHALTVAGRGQAAYVATLHDIVREREPATCVTLDARCLSDAEFDAQLDAADVLILPHVAESTLVSGAFFEAIGWVPVVIGRAIPFMRGVAAQFDNVLRFQREDELPELVRYVAANWPRFAAPETVATKRQ